MRHPPARGSGAAYRGSVTSVWWLRWLIVAIGAVVGVVLIARHNVLIGALILVMAVSRAAILVAIAKRRAGFRARRRGRFGPP
jgi:hypothetical protein